MSDDKKVIFSMSKLSKTYSSSNKQVLKDIYLSFFYGAKIGILGLNAATDRPAEGQLATAISRITELLFAVDGRADPRVKDANGDPVMRALAVFLQHPEAFVSALADAVAARLAQDAE